jgi:hypothetical protein
MQQNVGSSLEYVVRTNNFLVTITALCLKAMKYAGNTYSETSVALQQSIGNNAHEETINIGCETPFEDVL